MFHNLKSQRTLDNSTLEIRLNLINRNLLYVSHRVDHIVKLMDIWKNEDKLQSQVDEYFGSKNSDETSPQTDSDEQ